MKHDIEKAMHVASLMMDNMERQGGVKAVQADMQREFGIEFTIEQVKAIMTCGGTVVLLAMHQAMDHGVVRIDRARLSQAIAEHEARIEGSSSSETPEPNSNAALDAEREAQNVLERVRKLH